MDEKDLQVLMGSDALMGEFCHDCVCLGSDFEELMSCYPSCILIIREAFIDAVMTMLNEQEPMTTKKASKMNHPGGSIHSSCYVFNLKHQAWNCRISISWMITGCALSEVHPVKLITKQSRT